VPKAGTPLPTVLTAGSATAFYTVKNNTATTRNNNHVRYLPLNVTQVTNAGGDTCGPLFNLTSGGSCTLQLKISGEVNAADRDPHHHLFVCFPGDVTCAGTNYPLNVGAEPPPTPGGILGRFLSSSCTGSGASAICIAGGTVSDDAGLAYTIDGGSTWKRSLLSNIPLLFAQFNATSCTGTGATAVCTAVGEQDQKPLLLVSRDGTATWTKISNTYTGRFKGTSCTGSDATAICTAVGANTDGFLHISETVNGGSTWRLTPISE